ncbi:MAG: MCE family protein [Nocardioides sp.]|nr:MCE family protein [Nocardioides sp.]
MSRGRTTATAAVKLAIFTVVSLFFTGLLVVIMGNIGFGSTSEYQAEFTTASMLDKGDDVRVAGVKVGDVRSVEIVDGSRALVTFRAHEGLQLTKASRAEIRFLNLVGDRYLALERGAPDAEEIEPGATIPVENTRPALDLSALFSGFRPLFEALQPAQVNELSLNIVRTLQGESGTVESLLANTASLTSHLADRDQLIGQVVDNLTSVLTTVDDRHGELDTLVVELDRWMGSLAQDREVIGEAVDSVGGLSQVLADLLEEGRPLLRRDIAELRELATRLNQPKNEAVLVELLERLPQALKDQTRTGTYGSWYNYYLCDVKGQITLPALKGPGVAQLQRQLNSIALSSTAPRCQR